MILNTVEELIEDIRQGKMVILMDDEDRENEGDLVMAAPMVRPEDINFMATNARGLICLTLSEQRCQQLSLSMMVASDNNNSSHGTPFTLSIERLQRGLLREYQLQIVRGLFRLQWPAMRGQRILSSPGIFFH